MQKDLYRNIKQLISTNDDDTVFLGIELMKSLKGPLLYSFMEKLARKDIYLLRAIDAGFSDGMRKLGVKKLKVNALSQPYQREESALDPAICYMVELLEIELNSLKITEIPAQIHQLHKLKHLYLGDNEIIRLPEEVCELPKLRSLFLNANPLEALPKNMHQLSELRQVNLSYCPIEQLPKTLALIKKLSFLALSYTKKLKRLPKELFQPLRLNYLSLEGSAITSLPSQICIEQYHKIQYINIDISHTEIKSLQPLIEMDVSAVKAYLILRINGCKLAEEEIRALKEKSNKTFKVRIMN